jgi:methyl-accepting chemotaxis protein
MAMLAMWFQETYTFSSGNGKLLMVFIGLVAVAMVVQAIATIVLAVGAFKAMKGVSAAIEEVKVKTFPLIDSVKEMGHTAHKLLHETAPKVTIITDNLVQTSHVVKNSAQEFDKTIRDANMRTQRQVARVDGMVSAALTTTAEIVETVNNGIRGPALKIAAIAAQAKNALEGILDKIKAKTGGSTYNR